MDLKVWQEDSSGQECHTGSGLELDFPFVPLALRAEPWPGGCGGDDRGEGSLRSGTHTASAASFSASSVGWRPALNSCTLETFGRVISLQYIWLMERISQSTRPSGISSFDTPECERLKVQCARNFEGVLPDSALFLGHSGFTLKKKKNNHKSSHFFFTFNKMKIASVLHR